MEAVHLSKDCHRSHAHAAIQMATWEALPRTAWRGYTSPNAGTQACVPGFQ